MGSGGEGATVGAEHHDGRQTGGDPRAVAARTGRPVAGAYWPCLVCWTGGAAASPQLRAMDDAARRWDARSLVLTVTRTSRLVLLADDATSVASRRRVRTTLVALLAAGAGERPGVRLRGVADAPVTPDDRLALVAARLHDVDRHRPVEPAGAVVWARSEAFGQLLEALDARSVRAFVDQQLAPLAAHEHDHGSDLARVLELALDHEDRSDAARAAFMHRNTFRRQLGRAVDVLAVDLDCPEERLALHLALKLRAVVAASDASWCAVHRSA